MQELYDDLHAKGMKLYVAVPVNDRTFDYAGIAGISDGLILMNYDQHYPGGEPGAVAGQDWFLKNLQDALKVIPERENHLRRRQLRLRLGDEEGPEEGHAAGSVHSVSVQDAWLEASRRRHRRRL